MEYRHNKTTPRSGKRKTTVVSILDDPHGFDVYVGKTGLGFSSEFGNPFRVGRDGSQEDVLRKYRDYFFKRLEIDPEWTEKVLALKGLRLGCICRSPSRCHATIIATYLNSLP